MHHYGHTITPTCTIVNTPHIMNSVTTHEAFVGLGPNDYLADSAATTHISNNYSHFINYESLPPHRQDSVVTGAGPMKVVGYGTAMLADDTNSSITIHHVMHVPSSPVCIFSTTKLNETGGSFLATPYQAFIYFLDKVLMLVRTFRGIFLLTASPPPHEMFAATQGPTQLTSKASSQQWHLRLGHPGKEVIRQLVSGHLVEGLEIVGDFHTKDCLSCIKGKFKKTPYPTSTSVHLPLDTVFVDTCGPLPKCIQGCRYFIVVRDRATGYTMVHIAKEKTEAAQFVIHCIEFLEKHANPPAKVKRVRMDRGGEFVNHTLLTYLHNKGIQPQITSAECSASNGVAERAHLTIMDRVRSTLIESNQPRLLWSWAVHHVVKALNYLPYTNNSKITKTPYEHLTGSKPNISHLKAFGAKVVAWVPVQHQSDKLAPRGADGRLVGYCGSSPFQYQVCCE